MTNMQRKNALGLLVVAGPALCFGVANPTNSLAQSSASQVLLNDASPQGSMAVYKDFARYPPESRLLSASNWDLLHPWSTDTSSSPMIPQQVMRQVESLVLSGVPVEEAFRNVTLPPFLPTYQFEMNKTVLAGTRDGLIARLVVTPDAETNKPVRIHVTKAELIGDDDFGSPRLGLVPYSCESAAPACTFRWKAPAPQTQYWGALQLVVTVGVEGMADEFVLRRPFYSSPIVAGKFTGQFHERLDNGSLVIDAGVEVHKHMACFVSANLFSVDKGMPTQHVERHMIVDPSMKAIALTFFGKIFRDYGHEGQFRLQDLKAQCENLSYPPEWSLDSVAYKAELLQLQNMPETDTREPTQIYFDYNSYSYTTHRYASSVFSDQEWQSPEKTHKLEMLKQAAADLDNPAMEMRKRQLQQQLK